MKKILYATLGPVMMRKGFFVYLFLGMVCGFGAHALDYAGNVVVGANEVINDVIYITENTTIENYGVLRGNIIFNGAYDLIIRNHNTIESNFTTVSGATITQQVFIPGDLNIITNLASHTIEVNNAYMLNMSDLLAISGAAGEVVVSNSVLAIDGTFIANDVPIYLNYTDTLFIDGTNLSGSCALLPNVYGLPNTLTGGADSMYVVTPYIESNVLGVRLARQTNYSAVFDGALGGYLDSLRVANPNDRLIKQLDRANTRSALNGVMDKSARLNPILLARPMQIINTLDDTRVFHDSDSMATITPLYISSDDFSMWGGMINVSGKLADNIFAKFGLVGGKLNYDGKFDEYNSVLYGGNFDVAYLDNDYYFGAFGNLAFAKFKDISVFENDKVTKNPNGFAGRFGLDAGIVYTVSDEIKMVPFIGGMIDYSKVLGENDTDFNARGGLDMTVDTIQDGNKYSVGLRAFVQTDGGIYAMLHSNMLSVADGVGGGMNIGALYSDSVFSYKMMLDINFLF